MLIEILKNQIALAMFVFFAIVVGAFITMDGVTAKEIIIQIITAIGALVTGVAMERSRAQRATDAADETVAKIKGNANIEAAKKEEVPNETV